MSYDDLLECTHCDSSEFYVFRISSSLKVLRCSKCGIVRCFKNGEMQYMKREDWTNMSAYTTRPVKCKDCSSEHQIFNVYLLSDDLKFDCINCGAVQTEHGYSD